MKKILIIYAFSAYMFGACLYNIDMNNKKIQNVKSAYDVYIESNKTIDVSHYALTYKALYSFGANAGTAYFASPRISNVFRYQAFEFCFTLKNSDMINDGIILKRSTQLVSFNDAVARKVRGDYWYMPYRESFINIQNQYTSSADINVSEYGKLNQQGYKGGGLPGVDFHINRVERGNMYENTWDYNLAVVSMNNTYYTPNDSNYQLLRYYRVTNTEYLNDYSSVGCVK